jgi:hypothetical protein
MGNGLSLTLNSYVLQTLLNDSFAHISKLACSLRMPRNQRS